MRKLLIALAISLVGTLGQAQADVTQQQAYVGSFTVAGACVDGVGSVGQVCFELGSERYADITIIDATGLPVMGYYQFFGGSTDVPYRGVFCGSASRVPIPDGSTDVFIAIGWPFRFPYLGPCVVGVGTTGTVELRTSLL